MDVKDYELLLELAEQKNITKVSQTLFITQPAITKRIQRMEEELQCELFIRSKKGVILTPAGEAILPYAKIITDNNRIMRDLVAASQDDVCGTLNIGVSINFSQYRLPKILSEYTQKYPKVDITVISGQSRDLVHKMQRGEISVAVVRGQFDFDGESELLSTEDMYLVCSEENKNKDLRDYPYIGRHTDSALQEQLKTWLAINHLSDLRPKFQIDHIGTCMEMAKYGLGWCILPEICLDNFTGYKKKLLLDVGKPFTRKTYVLYRKPYDELPQVKLFLEALRKIRV